MGYEITLRNYHCYNPFLRKVVISRDVQFKDDIDAYTNRLKLMTPMKQQTNNSEDLILFPLGPDTSWLLETSPTSDQELHDSPIIIAYRHEEIEHASQFEHASTREQHVVEEIPNQEAPAHMSIRAPMDPLEVARSFEQPCAHITFLPQI